MSTQRKRVKNNFGAALKFQGSKGKAGAVDAVINTPTIDRDYESVLPLGGDLTDYKNGPSPVLFNHDSNIVIGSSKLDPLGPPDSCSVFPDESLIWATCYFVEEDPISRDVRMLVEKGFVSATSIGFMPRESQIIKSPLDHGPEEIVQFTRWALMEWSFVPIGSNPDCLRSELAGGRVGKHLLNPTTLKLFGIEKYIPKSWSIATPTELHRSKLQSQSKLLFKRISCNKEGNVPDQNTETTPQVPPGMQFAQELLSTIGGIFVGVKSNLSQVEQPDVRKVTLSICSAIEPAMAAACDKLKEIYPDLEIPKNPNLDYSELEKAEPADSNDTDEDDDDSEE